MILIILVQFCLVFKLSFGNGYLALGFAFGTNCVKVQKVLVKGSEYADVAFAYREGVVKRGFFTVLGEVPTEDQLVAVGGGADLVLSDQ